MTQPEKTTGRRTKVKQAICMDSRHACYTQNRIGGDCPPCYGKCNIAFEYQRGPEEFQKTASFCASQGYPIKIGDKLYDK